MPKKYLTVCWLCVAATCENLCTYAIYYMQLFLVVKEKENVVCVLPGFEEDQQQEL